MGVRFNCASSTLLCAEDNSSILDFDDDAGDGHNGENEEFGLNGKQRCDLDGDSLMGFLLQLQSEESLSLMIKRECELLPRGDYSKRLMDGEMAVSVRGDAIDWITKVITQYSFSPLTACLSINYLDRFLSVYEVPKSKVWMTQLLSVACLSLAAKMEETEVPLILDLQVGEAKYMFEAKTIQRMELLVLNTLKWRMQAVTPFSFLDYFLNKFNNGDSKMMSLVSRSIELIINSIRGIGALEFRPSEIAAAAALVSLKEIQAIDIDKALTDCIIDLDKSPRSFKSLSFLRAKKPHWGFGCCKLKLWE
ncbi:uncharacterized protein A4U43_C03F18890 [Asparagus officinalis]|uniref:Uncharacterized protein n=1 Tax=Asparagus officinalis TaxID=4686 RepID=A0A5P1FFI9_ASPOF|nr:uncharacterized protein A4U43_C03F18890 [Asparagus officinalis]